MTTRRRRRPWEIAPIRQYHRAGYLIVDLADCSEVHPSVIGNIVNGKTHKNITEEAATLPRLIKETEKRSWFLAVAAPPNLTKSRTFSFRFVLEL